MSETSLTCGCIVTKSRDFLGRVVGIITTRGEGCTRPDHVAGHVLLMPGREHAGRPDLGIKSS